MNTQIKPYTHQITNTLTGLTDQAGEDKQILIEECKRLNDIFGEGSFIVEPLKDEEEITEN